MLVWIAGWFVDAWCSHGQGPVASEWSKLPIRWLILRIFLFRYM